MRYMPKEERPEDRLVPITVRFTQDGYDAISDIANRYKMSKAEIVRLATDDRLVKYLGSLVYVDPDQGEILNKAIGKIGTELEKMRLELNRIGVNYNQEIKLKNIQAKYKHCTHYEELVEREKEERKIRDGIDCVTEDGMKNIIDRFDDLVKKTGELLCTLV